jgi:hypothetical protein
MTPYEKLLARVRVRVHVEVEDECWRWRGAVNGGASTPCIGWGRRCVAVRRVMYELLHDVRLTRRDCMTSTCGRPDCVAPEHMERVNRRELSERMRLRGTLSVGLRHSLAVTESARRRRHVKLSLERARAMRARYQETNNAALVAREFGVSHAHAHRVVRGDWWREPSPWAI